VYLESPVPYAGDLLLSRSRKMSTASLALAVVSLTSTSRYSFWPSQRAL
jgi:hypothetical protein